MPDTPDPPHASGDSPSELPTVQAFTSGLSSPHSTLDSSASTSRDQQSDPAEPSVRAPQSVGNYDLLEEIGRGAMGVVYKARERHSGRVVALKMMLDRSGRGGNRTRFALEARASGRLSHPGIVTIHAWGEHNDQPFYTMDYVHGTLLSRLLEDGPLPCERAVNVLIGVARAVAAAHKLGVVHRDLKPGNVIIDAASMPRVLDFGLAKRLSAPTGELLHPSLDGAGNAMSDSAANPPLRKDAADRQPTATEHGAILGTPAYMAPEQARGDHSAVGPATDVYALGTILYEMLTGRPPFQGGSVHEILQKVTEREPPPLRSWGPRVPAAVEEVCCRAMHKNPSERYRDAGQLAEHLEMRWRQCSLAPRFARLTALATLAFTVLAALWLATRGLPARWLNPAPLAAGSGSAEPLFVALTLVNAVVLYGGGLLAWLSGLAWLGAWVWHSDRAAWIVVASILLLAAGTAACLRAPPLLREAAILAPAMAAAVACGVWLRRRSVARSGDNSGTAAREPFLGRLIAASALARRTVEARQDQLARTTGPVRVGFDDFEIGKTLHRWTGGKVQRGRQKSLSRPVLVWSESEIAAADEVPPVVLARERGLLSLYAIGAGPEGRFLVTEPAAGTPLADLIGRLTPPQILTLVARLARIVETLHEQGACHARLTADWVLVHGEMEPTLCPNTIPCRSAEDRRRDVQALGELLLQMLSSVGAAADAPAAAEPGAAALGEAARRGDYATAAELGTDLDRRAQILRQRWRAQLSAIVVIALAALPWMGLAALGERFAALLPAALAPACLLLGYTHARTLQLRHRLRQPLGRRTDLVKGVLPLLLLALPPAVLAGHGPLATTFPDVPLSGLLLSAELLTSWLAGILLAILVTTAETVWRTLQGQRNYGHTQIA